MDMTEIVCNRLSYDRIIAALELLQEQMKRASTDSEVGGIVYVRDLQLVLLVAGIDKKKDVEVVEVN
jgi:hypothetical protein